MRLFFNQAKLAFLTVLVISCSKPAPDETAAKSKPFTANAKLPDGMLDRRNLIEYSMAVRDYKPNDEFSEQSLNSSNLIGRKFKLDLDLGDPANADLPKVYYYEPTSKTLNLTVYPGAIEIFDETIERGAEQRSNAFGATVSVKMIESRLIAVGPIEPTFSPYNVASEKPDEIGVFPLKMDYDPTFNQTRYSFGEVQKKMKMEPEAARRITSGLHLIVEGYIVKNKYDQNVLCETSANKATLNSPVETITNRCTVSSRLTKIAVLSRDGNVLASW